MPNDTERHAIVGTTGSGKTIFGLWCLSHRSYTEMPWIIIDSKRDEHIAQLPADEIKTGDDVPREAGLYVVRPTVDEIDDGAVSDLLMRIWDAERTGIFIDEGYMLPPRDRGLRTVLTQGRSKRIPMICLSQRPAFVSPFLLSESEVKSIFYLEHPADIERVNEWMPACNPHLLQDHESYWYQRSARIFRFLGPCEGPDLIIQRFRDRLQGPEPVHLDLWGRKVYERPAI
jgi:DNA helicase HerA-like ATPase